MYVRDLLVIAAAPSQSLTQAMACPGRASAEMPRVDGRPWTALAIALVCLAAAACGQDPVTSPADSGGNGGDAAADAGGGGTDVDVDSIGGEDTGTDGDDAVNDVDSPNDADKDSAGEDTGGGATDAVQPTDVVADTGDTAGDTGTADSGDVAKEVDESKGLASDELLIKILGPSGRDWAQSDSDLAQLAGVIFGQADSVEWSNSAGKNDTIPLDAWWVSGIIELQEGDNHITVTAKKGSVVATDSIRIVYNPFFTFEGSPQISPDVLFVGESAKLVVRMPLSAASSGATGKGPVNPDSVQLVEVDADGKKIQDVGKMVDNGQAGSCDDIQKDGYFSLCLNLTPNVAKRMYYRVEAQVTVLDKSYTARTPLTQVDVVPRLSQGECQAIVGLQKKAKADAIAAVAGGASPTMAAAAALQAVKTDASVDQAGIAQDGTAVWIRYKSGRLGAVQLPGKGMRGAPGAAPAPGKVSSGALPTYSVGSRRGVALAPNALEFQAGFPAGEGDEAQWAGTALAARECPPFSVDAANGDKALLSYYRNLWQYGIIAISGHGTTLFKGMDPATGQALGWEHLGSQEVLFSGEAVNCSSLSASPKSCTTDASCTPGQECIKTSANSGVCVDHTQGDIMSGRIVIGDETYGTLPAFYQRHMRQDMPASIVYLGACRTLTNGSVAVQFLGAKAAAIVGYVGDVSNAFAWSHGKEFFDKVINHSSSVLQGVSTFDTDPATGGAMRWLGNGKANANDGTLINSSWDLGKPTGWKAVGDGRVISRLGITIPVAGKFMGIISTGLGFTAQSGSLEQPFCIEPGKAEMCFYWKFYSEEFIEFCGSAYMDRFTAKLSSKQGQLTLTDVWIDPLCPWDCGNGKVPCTPGSAQCKCGAQWKTLDPADVSFDQGGVYATPWQKDCKNIEPFAGKRADLKFYVTDTGDSIYDSAILIDEVTIK